MPNMKTEMNHNLLTQKIKKSRIMEYSEHTVKFIPIVIEDLRKNTMQKEERFAQRYVMHKRLNIFG